MKGLIASVLNLKPMIGVEKVNGTYIQRGQARSFKKALAGLTNLMRKHYDPNMKLRVQVLYSNNPDGAKMLKEKIDQVFDCNWLPMGPMSLVFGAHTGSSMVGVAFAPESVFEGLPE